MAMIEACAFVMVELPRPHKIHCVPPLGSVINKPDEAILLDILDPSRHIESDFTSYLVVTHQGLTFTGILASDSATSVTLRKDKGASETILRKDIEVMEASQLSERKPNQRIRQR